MDLYAKYVIEADKIPFCGDAHLNSSTPRSRLDDYSETTIMKLENLRLLCVSRGYKAVVMLGDVFHKTQQPISYINRVMAQFQKFKDSGIMVFSDAGNHDLTYEKMEYLDKSALGTLYQAGVILPFSLIQVNTSSGYSVNLYGYHYPDAIKEVMVLDSKAKVNICVAHRFYNYSFSDSSLDDKQIETLGYDIYALGHDHVPYPVACVNDKHYVVRPGRFMRGTSHNYNIEDSNVYVDVVEFGGNSDDVKASFIREILDVKEAKEIFAVSAQAKDKSKNILEDLTMKVDELLNHMDAGEMSDTSVYTIMDAMEIDPRIKERVELYLRNQGILRKEIKLGAN